MSTEESEYAKDDQYALERAGLSSWWKCKAGYRCLFLEMPPFIPSGRLVRTEELGGVGSPLFSQVPTADQR